MASFRFIGTYTGDRDSINACGVMFYGNEPAEVNTADGVRRLRNNPEFEEIGGDEGGLTDVNALRAEYKERFGKRPYNGWDEATLREKLA